MKKQSCTLLAVALLLASMGMALAQARSSLTFSVTFPFRVAKTTFPPGTYQLVYAGGNSRNLQITNKKTGKSHFVQYITRLSARQDGNVVFDHYDQERYLSEVYIGGSDGFQIQSVPNEHDHEVAEVKPENP